MSISGSTARYNHFKGQTPTFLSNPENCQGSSRGDSWGGQRCNDATRPWPTSTLCGLADKHGWPSYQQPTFTSEDGRWIPYAVPASLSKLAPDETWATYASSPRSASSPFRSTNPDGVAHFQRELAFNYDTNRDRTLPQRRQTKDVEESALVERPARLPHRARVTPPASGLSASGRWPKVKELQVSHVREPECPTRATRASGAARGVFLGGHPGFKVRGPWPPREARTCTADGGTEFPIAHGTPAPSARAGTRVRAAFPHSTEDETRGL
ncbi:hypothetical protein LZ31DRAFT_631065 [Colletotrichum somersetense]|nr:hypothetical protein LZ31DRAFT_631065 [Colletotrichum somersetense]